MTDEEYRTTVIVYAALDNLCSANPIWRKNLEVYQGMPRHIRYVWWKTAQKQAELGVPAMQELVSAVILLRLTS